MMSEGEEYIAYFLEAEGIKFKQEYPIDKLNGDSKSHRVADFYLPRYNVYIEFFGQWQDETHKARYREKKEIYIQNRVPCVILYPENLGILDFIFHHRLQYVFNRYKLDAAKRRYQFDELKKERKDNLLLIILGMVILGLAWPWTNPDNSTLLYIGLALFGYQTYLITKSIVDIYNHFPKEKDLYPEKRIEAAG